MSEPISIFQVRDATLVDRALIVEFNRRLALETEGKVLNSARLDAGVSQALTDPERLRYRVAEIGSPPSVIGQAATTREWSDWRNGWVWWLQSVYVEEPYRGRGAFRALYHHIHQQARALPDVLGLRLYVENANEAARKTYQSLGMNPGGYSVYEDLWIERFAEP